MLVTDLPLFKIIILIVLYYNVIFFSPDFNLSLIHNFKKNTNYL